MQASCSTPTIPVGPSYCDVSRPSASATASSVAVPVTGIGRVCGVSASSAPSVTTISTPSSSAKASSSWQKDFQRMLGSMPWTSTTSRCCSGSRATVTRVVGHSSSRAPEAPKAIVGRLTWKS